METNNKLELSIEVSYVEGGIDKLEKNYLPLVVKDFNDKAGFNACDKARKEVKAIRCAIENQRKEYKKPVLALADKIDSDAKEITAKLLKVENHLIAQCEIRTSYLLKLEQKEKEKKQAILNDRVVKLEAVKAFINTSLIGAMTDEEFNIYLAKETERFNKEEETRIAQEKELERLKEVERQAQAKLEEERKKAEEANRELIKLQQAELAKKEFELAEQRKIEAERLAHEAKIKAEQEAKERAEKEAKAKADAELLKQAKDKKLVEYVLSNFDTLEKSQAEIVKLYKQFNILG